jgi:hypothetical protein
MRLTQDTTGEEKKVKLNKLEQAQQAQLQRVAARLKQLQETSTP